MRKLFLLLGLFALVNVALNAQVAIGINEAPQKFSVLELISGTNKGLRLPQMNTTERNTMQASAEFQAEKANKAIGLVIFNTQTGCEEVWDGTEWKSLCGNQGKADFTISSCSQIVVNGAYYDGVALTSGNYLTIPVTVTKPGTYQISVVANSEVTNLGNGYYFTISGEFLATGLIRINVPGMGSPTYHTQTGGLGDEIVISLNGVEVGNCTGAPRIIVGDASIRPKFTINCASPEAFGVVRKNIALNSSNYIKLRLNVQSEAVGAQWIVYTDEIDGIRYAGSGKLTAPGAYEVILYGEGTTGNTTLKEFTIFSNSESSTATCKVTVQPVIASKKIIEFAEGAGSPFGMAAGNGWGTSDMLINNMNFGSDENSIVKYEGFTSINHVAAAELTVAILNNNNFRAQDVIVITYNVWVGPAARDSLVKYVNDGGVLIYLSQRSEANTTALIGAIFGESLPAPIDMGAACARHIKITGSINDEITNGPFGDVRDRQWGEDYANSCALTSIPNGAIVYSGTVNAATGVSTSSGRVTLLRHPSKNFIWCGDSGFIRGDATTNNSNTDSGESPVKLGLVTLHGINYPKYPVEKNNYGSSNPMPVCNSIMFANMMAWALKMSEINGINSGNN